MRPLSPADILRVWEEGEPRHPLDRALLPLAAALPDWPWSDLTRLSIGRRDGLLLRLRGQTLGPRLEMLAACPQCQELMEFEADTAELVVADAGLEPPPPGACRHRDAVLPFRRLDSRDLAAVTAGPRTAARQRLAAASLQIHGEPAIDVAADEVAAALADADPQAEIVFGLACPACGHTWSALFDVADFFWREITGLARRLLDEVQELAAHYGWSEAEIVGMSPARRRHYLERARR